MSKLRELRPVICGGGEFLEDKCVSSTRLQSLATCDPNFQCHSADWAAKAAQRAYAYAVIGISAISNQYRCAEIQRTIDLS
jgi:hypothetical protein